MKKIVLLIVFTLSFFSLSAKNIDFSSKDIILLKQDKIEYGVCTFTYRLTATNSITGETRTFVYTHSVYAISQLDCQNAAEHHVRMHVLRLSSELND